MFQSWMQCQDAVDKAWKLNASGDCSGVVNKSEAPASDCILWCNKNAKLVT